MTTSKWVPIIVMGLALAACSGPSSDSSATSSAGRDPTSSAANTTLVPGHDEEQGPFRLTSPAFVDGAPIPRQFTCDGANVSPPLRWDAQPDGTQSLALVVVDPDAPKQGGFVHWVLAGIDPPSAGIAEGSNEYVAGEDDSGETGWTGPCPPSGTHDYVFTIHAFDHAADFAGVPTRDKIEAEPGRLGSAVVTGTYSRES